MGSRNTKDPEDPMLSIDQEYSSEYSLKVSN
jgi:hypothetical protein